MTDSQMIAAVREIERGQAWKVKSRTNPTLAHTVRRSIDGTHLHCSCPATGACWHLVAINAFHAAQLADSAAWVDEEFDRMNAQAERTKAERMADLCAVPVNDADDWDPFAPGFNPFPDDTDDADEADPTTEAEALRPAPAPIPRRHFATFIPPPAVPSPDWTREQAIRAGGFS